MKTSQTYGTSNAGIVRYTQLITEPIGDLAMHETLLPICHTRCSTNETHGTDQGLQTVSEVAADAARAVASVSTTHLPSAPTSISLCEFAFWWVNIHYRRKPKIWSVY